MKIISALFIIYLLFLSTVIFADDSGQALRLDGKDDYVIYPELLTPSISSFTLSAWVKSYVVKKDASIIYKGAVNGDAQLAMTENKWIFAVKLTDGKWHCAKADMSGTNNYQYLVGRYFKGDRIEIWINNTLKEQLSIPDLDLFLETFHHSAIGAVRYINSPLNCFNGYIDEARIYNRAISEQEIEYNMNRELIGNEEGLVLYYNFNELTPDGKIEDLSPYGNHGTLMNGATLVPSDAPVKSPYPPELSVIAKFSNEILKANESGQISITINNSGKGDAENVKISLSSTNPNIVLNDSQTIGTIQANSSHSITLTISGKETLSSGDSEVKVNISADDGHYANSSITIPTQTLFVKPLYPPDLIVDEIEFIEPSGNQALDAYESGEIQFTLNNQGRGKAQNIHITLSPLSSSDGIEYTSSQIIELLGSKEGKKVSFNLIGEPLIKTVSRKFRVQITEEFGFDADPFNINFETKAYDPPDLRIEQIAINDKEEGDAYGNGNSIIESGESIEVTAYIQNYGIGAAEDVTAKVILETTDKNITCLDTDKTIEIGTIPAGDYKHLKFYFYTSRRYNNENIPLTVELNEAKGLYGKTKDLGLKLGERTQNIVDVQVVQIEKPTPEIKEIAEVIKSDVDDPLQKTKTKRPDGLAVIIGIEKYRYAPEVSFAERDAGAFYNTAIKLLGISEHNIYYITNENATKGEFEKLFGQDGWLSKRVCPETEIFVYYSGHGSPDIKTKEAYLIPYDIDPNYANKGYPIDMLYENLHSLDAKSTTVILDACFVGQSRENEALFAGARPVVPVIASPLAYGRITVFTATEENQISSGYPKEGHGLFTYFFLKGMLGDADLNGNRSINVNELSEYLKKNVQKTAGQMDREQIPQVIGDMEKVIVIF